MVTEGLKMLMNPNPKTIAQGIGKRAARALVELDRLLRTDPEHRARFISRQTLERMNTK